ncbi:hypothetical protein BW686_16840 [Pseudomonas syringae]|uniref:NERD domain-containing protein n=1 Tax=Pseudomonas syringae TaxID=317 RepID=A0A244EPD0_PSESX|nr:hypothetical protein [Pseudomonas syringae]OUM06346.1 hypothetical protein BW686_16840 [Pseudomonas syringae]
MPWINVVSEFSEVAIHKALSKLSWKLLKKEMDKIPWRKYPVEFLELIMRSDSLLNKRKNTDKEKKREELFSELLAYVAQDLDAQTLDLYKRRLVFFWVADECFSEILKFEEEMLALKDLQSDSRVWSAMKWYVGDSQCLQKQVEDRFKGEAPVLLNTLSIIGEGGIPVDPSSYHIQQVGALGSAILMEAYRNSWFDSLDAVVIPDEVETSDDDVYKAGSIFYNANVWALLDDLQQQVRYLGRDFQLRDKDQYESPPAEFKFGVEFGATTDAEIFDFIAGQRNSNRESSNYFSFNKDAKLNDLLDAIAAITGSTSVKERHVSVSSLAVLLNYDVAKDDTLYEGLNLLEWVYGFCGLREFCKKLHSKSAEKIYLSSELITFGKAPLLEYLMSTGLSQDKSACFIHNVTFHRRSRDLFDCPLIKTSSGYVVVSDILLRCVVSRAVVSNILSRKCEFKKKGSGLEGAVRGIFSLNKIEVTNYKKKFAGAEGEYEYDALVLWGGKLFIIECKNRWLCEGRSVAIFNHLKQVREDVAQINRLVAGLKLHPEMVNAAFGHTVAYDQIIPCVVAGLTHAMSQKISGVYFTDISIISRFFSDRHLGVDYGGEKESSAHMLYDQWAADKPSVSDFIKTLERPVQVALGLGGISFRPVELAVGACICLKAEIITGKDLDFDGYRELVATL